MKFSHREIFKPSVSQVERSHDVTVPAESCAMAAAALIAATTAPSPYRLLRRTANVGLCDGAFIRDVGQCDAHADLLVDKGWLCHFRWPTDTISTKGKPLSISVSLTKRVASAATCQPLAHKPPKIDCSAASLSK